MNANQGIITFSQKNIHKKTHKTLLKLASRIVFIFDSNSKKKQSRNFRADIVQWLEH